MKKLILGSLVILLVFVAVNAQADTVHSFKLGDTLWELSAKHYNDPTLYPILLRVNRIDNPRTIQVGTKILIPDSSKMRAVTQETDPRVQQEMINNINTGLKQDEDSKTDDADQSPDAISRSGKTTNHEDTRFRNILRGPQVSADELIKVGNP